MWNRTGSKFAKINAVSYKKIDLGFQYPLDFSAVSLAARLLQIWLLGKRAEILPKTLPERFRSDKKFCRMDPMGITEEPKVAYQAAKFVWKL